MAQTTKIKYPNTDVVTTIYINNDDIQIYSNIDHDTLIFFCAFNLSDCLPVVYNRGDKTVILKSKETSPIELLNVSLESWFKIRDMFADYNIECKEVNNG